MSDAAVPRESSAPPTVMPASISAATTAAEKTSAVASFARTVTLAGIGEARLRRIQPWARSTATPTPNEKSAAPITPKAP
jgi:hypothetical protein